MSAKRAATTELNHDNWDQDDPSEHEEMGTFKAAPKEVLEKRVIRTAKRRSQITSEDGNKGVFSGFGGFNKTQPSSFDFLANLTNGNKNNSSSKSKSDTVVTSSLFSSKPLSSSPVGTIFGTTTTAATATKATFGIPTQSSSLFGVSSSNTQTSSSIFTASKADSTVGDSPFKVRPISSTTEVSKPDTISMTNNTGSKVTSSLFGVSSTNVNTGKSLFSMANSTPFKIQPVSSSTTIQTNFSHSSTSISKPSLPGTNTDTKDDKKLKYYAKLKGLNESVSDWIKKHVEETPLCILTPIFKDYEKYLKEMQEEYQGKEEKEPNKIDSDNCSDTDRELGKNDAKQGLTAFSSNAFISPSKSESPNSKPLFGNQNSVTTLGEKPNFSFGTTKKDDSSNIPTTGFSFGMSTSPQTTTTNSLFSVTSSINSNGNAPFSFGIGKPFSFNSNIQKPMAEKAEDANEETNDDEPPKVEYTPVVEENSVFDKKCKIFVKKDGNFVDKGVGTLYIKKIEESGKHQLLVRANTSLGNILVNLILAEAIPTQRMGKNNVMLVCIPTPDTKPPPTPMLIRVKTSEEADELLEILNKYKT